MEQGSNIGAQQANATSRHHAEANRQQEIIDILELQSESIGKIIDILDGLVEFKHDPVAWNADRKMCACGMLWPHD